MVNKKKHHHHNVYSIDFYASNSGLKDINEGLKTIAALTIIILCLAFNNVAVSVFVIISMGAFTVIMGKVPLKHYMGFMFIPVSFILLSAAAIAVNFSMVPVDEKYVKVAFFYVHIGKTGLSTAIHVSSKALGCVSTLYMLTFSTAVGDLITVFEKAHFPKILIALMDMIYRFIFILSDQVNNMNVSAKSRLGYEGYKRSCRTFGMIAGNLFIVSLKKAEASYDAMVSRCYDGEVSFLKEERPVESKHISAVVLYIMVLVFLHIVTIKTGGGKL